jgi:hypothetical protein
MEAVSIARYYEPTSGRFLSADPLGQAASPSLYDFAGGDPVNSFDPDGRCQQNPQSPNNWGQNYKDPNTPGATPNPPAGGTYQAVLVVLPDGTTYVPTTTVKNKAQADQLGVPIGSVAPVIVPPGQDPEGMINQWTVIGLSNNSVNFADTWLPASLGGQNDFKNQNPPATSIYDAYGNFEYGATGTAAGFTGGELQGAANLIHTGLVVTSDGQGVAAVPGLNQNPQNTKDIQSGINTVQNGGVVITVTVHYP